MLGDRLERGLNEAIGADAACQQHRSIRTVYLGAKSVRSYRDIGPASLAAREHATNDLRLHMLDNGIYLHARYVFRCHISACHDEDDIDRTVEQPAAFLSDGGADAFR
jgi:glutamate-1-semialdehyde aminotransferase